MTRTTSITILLACLACTPINESNDTQIGDDDGGAGETGDPEPVVDHGIAEYCVDRAISYNAFALDDIKANERWAPHIGRAYTFATDLEDKPSPLAVPLMCSFASPLFTAMVEDAAEQGGSPSCLVGGYHIQIPWLGASDHIGPGHARFPYSKDIITATVGNPPESGRHTWLAHPCCNASPTPEELGQDDWQLVAAFDVDNRINSRDADCVAWATSFGVHGEAGGYPALYEPLEMGRRTQYQTRCLSGRAYSATLGAVTAAATIGKSVPYHPTVITDQYPAIVNFDWVASLLDVPWDKWGFGAAAVIAIKAALQFIYLPPLEYEHARYNLGGGCHFPTSLRFDPNTGVMGARYTCPVGYYAEFSDFWISPDVVDKGIVGTCRLDGVDYSNGSGLVGGGVIAPYPHGTEGGHYYTVYDQASLAVELERSVAAGGVSDALSDLLVAADGEAVAQPGDEIAWWGSPWTALSVADAMDATLGYDVADLADAAGWTTSEAERFVDELGIERLGDMVEGLPEDMQDRRTSTMRAHNTWQVRLERGDRVIFLHFTAP